MSKLKVLISDSHNPYLNLATEEWIFHNMDPSQQVLFLWRNANTVVIGRNQNPWSECNLAKMKEDGIHLARRTTGGGAVYQDLGNSIFTFLSPKEFYHRENNIEVILSALKEFGIHGHASGRNDLLIPFSDGPRKFSGSAYREKKDRAFHHGTLLLHANLTKLGEYLTPNPKKLQAKGKESVRSRVANLTEVAVRIDHEQIVNSLVKSFENFYKTPADIEYLTMESLKNIPELKKQYETLSSFDWIYGHTLEFNQKMDEYLSLGFFEFNFKVDEARVTDLQIFTDCLYPQLVEDIRSLFSGKSFTRESVHEIFSELVVKYPDITEGLYELENWFYYQVEI